MTIAFNCSACGTNLKVADTLAGKKSKCPDCSAVNSVPGEKSAAGQEEKTDAKEAKERPAKKGKKGKGKKSGSKTGLMLAGAALVLFLVSCSCCGGGFAFYYFWSSGFDDLKYMPSDTTTIASERVEQTLNSKIVQNRAGKNPLFFPQYLEENPTGINNKYGLRNDNINRITTGNGGSGSITVVTTNSAADTTDITGKLSGTFQETMVGKYKMMECKAPGIPTFCVVGRKTVIYGNPDTVRSVLNRDKAPEWSTAMQAALNRADFSNSHVSMSDMTKATPDNIPGVNTGPKVEVLLTERHYSSGMTVRLTLFYKDANDAAAAVKNTKDLTNKHFMGTPLASRSKVSSSGNAVILEAYLSPDDIPNNPRAGI
jgi:phage FluMu protein Com